MNEEFEQIVQQESRRIYGLCFRLLGNAQEAEDLCQEVFARALQNFDRFERRSEPSTWLYRIGINAWKNRMRRKKKVTFFGFFQSEESSMENDPAPLEPKGNEPAPDKAMERAESEELLQKGLKSLDKEDREIIVLRDLEEKSYEELAEILSVPLGTVKSRLARAREALRVKLTPLLKAQGELS